MNVTNDTPFVDGLALGMGPDRKPCVSVLLKATFQIPEGAGGAPAIAAEEQLPLATEDELYKGDTTGSVRLESDVVPFKPRTDVVLVGRAYAPGGRPVPVLDVALRVGRVQQAVRIFGDRRWAFPSPIMVVPVMSEPEPFLEMPLVYERAFGGADHKGRAWCAQNHVGRGLIGKKTRESVDGKTLPNLEDPRFPIRSWDDQPSPAGFGFYGRSWQPRASLAGRAIHDLDPNSGLPSDFDFGFFNGAHPGLQVPGYLEGNEEVEMWHLTPDGYRRFRLAGLRPEMTVHTHGPSAEESAGVSREFDETRSALDAYQSSQRLVPRLDTLVFLPDERVFYQVWRGTCTLPDLALDSIASIDIRLADASAARIPSPL